MLNNIDPFRINFNQPYMAGEEFQNIINGALTGQIAGDGYFTGQCHSFFEERYGVKRALLTTSCTTALEMAAILCDVKQGDEVIAPSFTFVSSVNPFVMRGAKIVFADTQKDIPDIDADNIEELITEKTKVIVVVHYAGIACDMEKILKLAGKYNLMIVEDAAHAIESQHNGKQLGTLGDFGAFSFHETKNLISGEGGCLLVNDEKFVERAEIIWEKGTNRVAFHRGRVDKYQWVDIGSSYLPCDIIAAILYAQLSRIDDIQKMRTTVWKNYYERLKTFEQEDKLLLPRIPSYATVNGHMFYIVTNTPDERNKLMFHLNMNGIMAVTHYVPLHSSEFYKDKHDGRDLPNTDRFSSCLLRLPFYNLLNENQIDYVVDKIGDFYE